MKINYKGPGPGLGVLFFRSSDVDKKRTQLKDVTKKNSEASRTTRTTRTLNIEILLWRAWYVLFFDFLPGILCVFVFFSVFCFVFVFVPVKRTPRINQGNN
jgi:hypothetical protein